ncbi:MAG TPA: hypothetical protein VMZ91_02330 [Candidatus Paceibacterota bacterium]|nr:hypothetical protein [Candidatus Paceibacterota bacterium]
MNFEKWFSKHFDSDSGEYKIAKEGWDSCKKNILRIIENDKSMYYGVYYTLDYKTLKEKIEKL